MHLPRCKGTATIELAFVLPFLAMIVVLIFFEGWGMVNLLEVRTSDRYAAWKDVYGGGCDNNQINGLIMQNSAQNVTLDRSEGQLDTLRDLARLSRNYDTHGIGVGDLADHWNAAAPKGKVDAVSAEFPSEVTLWQRFQGPILGTDKREGNEWRFGQTVEAPSVIHVFLNELDETIGASGEMGSMTRGMYNNVWWTARP